MKTPTQEQLMDAMLDITTPAQGIQVQISADRKTLWINIDGVCILRVSGIPYITVEGA